MCTGGGGLCNHKNEMDEWQNDITFFFLQQSTFLSLCHSFILLFFGVSRVDERIASWEFLHEDDEASKDEGETGMYCLWWMKCHGKMGEHVCKTIKH